MPTQLEKAQTFRELHKRPGAFVIPNPWDAGTAKLLTSLGFDALATTSLGLANMLGQVNVTAAEILGNCRTIVEATDLPVSADLENCGADAPEAAALMIRLASATGAVGGSIEDATGDPSNPIYPFELSVERVRAAVETARSLSIPFLLTARADNLICGRNDVGDTIRRLQAFEEAGADVLYAPGLQDLETIKIVASSIRKPLNVSISKADKTLTIADLSAVGVKRISVGGMMSQLALATFLEAAIDMKQEGIFSIFRAATSATELRAHFNAARPPD